MRILTDNPKRKVVVVTKQLSPKDKEKIFTTFGINSIRDVDFTHIK